jgi:hypothetical protein
MRLPRNRGRNGECSGEIHPVLKDNSIRRRIETSQLAAGTGLAVLPRISPVFVGCASR